MSAPALDTPQRLSTAPAPARDRLAGLSAAGAIDVLTGLVSAEAAALRGHAPEGGVGPDADFLEAGMDSVTAAALRAATGLTQTTGAVCDHGTPARLATVLHEEFKRGGTDEHTQAVAADTPVAPPVRLSRGPATRRTVYVPSPLALGGAHQYARFAAHFHGRREVGAVRSRIRP